MTLSLKDVVRGKAIEPPIICVFGAPGIGKTTFAAGARNPVFLATEDGAGVVGPDRFNIKTFEEFQEALDVIKKEKHEYQALVGILCVVKQTNPTLKRLDMAKYTPKLLRYSEIFFCK